MMKRQIYAILLGGALCLNIHLNIGLSVTAWAETEQIANSEQIEARFQVLSKQLRCMVCDNQSIAESRDQSAKDFQLQLLNRLLAGESDSEIFDYFQSRYGDAVFMTAPFTPMRAIFWALPVLVLLIGYLGFFRRSKQTDLVMPDAEPIPPLSQSEKERLSAMGVTLHEKDPPSMQ